MKDASALYRLLGDEARLRLLRVLSRERLNVTELTGILGLAQSGVSRHLGLLKKAGFVVEEKDAGFTYYRLSPAIEGEDLGALWAALSQQFDQSSPDPAVRADEARLQEVLRLRKENFDMHGADTPDARQLVPGRSWAAWSRALGLLLPPLRIADLGCGEGYLTFEAARWAARVIAVDRSAVVLERARATGRRRRVSNVIWRQGELERLPIKDATVDVALLSQALHHAADPARAVNEAARITVPGGRVLILDLREHQEEWVRSKLGDQSLGFREAELKRLLTGAALRDVKVGVGARKSGDPFAVLIAVGTRPHAETREQGGNDHMSDVRARLERLLAERILLLDGAMGTMIQRHKPTEADFRGDRFKDHTKDLKGNNDLLILTRPDIISDIHHAYLEAGSDIIETNTFSSNAIAQADYGLQSTVYELNLEGARLAKAAADSWTARTPERPRFVAGAMGPTNRILSISPDVNNPAFRNVTFDELCEAFKEQARGLIDGGCDLLLLETIVDTLNAKAGIVALEEVFEEKGARLPVMISATITDRSGRTLSGQTIDAFWVTVKHAQPFSVGVNCALGARDMQPYVADLARIADCYVHCYPNAGLPNAFGEYDERPSDTAGLLHEFALSRYVNIVGGCCGTTPEHIQAIGETVANVPPREFRHKGHNDT